MASSIGNITGAGQRRRLTHGLIAIGLAVAIAATIITLGWSPGWLLVLFVPFWFGALGVIQAREKT
jgi:hypothetical protein